MAVQNGTNEWVDRLVRSANIPSFDAAYAIAAWFRIVTAPASYSYATIFSLRNEPAGTWYQDALNVFNIPGTGLFLDFYGKNNATVVEFLGGTALSLNTWYAAGLARISDTDRRLYIGTAGAPFALDGSSASPLGSRAANPAAEANIAESRSGVLQVGAVKVWTAALSLADLQGEQYYDLAQITAGIRFVIPVVDTGAGRGTDYSGSGFNFSTNGTMTDVADPPAVSWDSGGGTDVTVTAGPVGFRLGAPAAGVTAVRNVTVAAAPVGFKLGAPAASVKIDTTITAGPVGFKFGAPAAGVTAVQNVTIAAAPVGLRFGAPGAEVTSATNAIIAAGPVGFRLGAPAAEVAAVQNVTIMAAAVGIRFGAPGAAVAAERHVTIAAGPVGLVFGVGAGHVTFSTLINILELSGEIFTVVTLSGEINTGISLAGEINTLVSLEGEI